MQARPHPPAPPDIETSVDGRLKLINARAARAVFGTCGVMAGLGALLLLWAHQSGHPDAGPSVVLWLAFAALSAGLCLLPSAGVERGGLALFLTAGTTALLINAALRGQGVQTVGLIFLPLLLLLAALLTRPLVAGLLTLWSAGGLVLLYSGELAGWWKPSGPEPDAVVHLTGLLLSCAMALLVGLLAAVRFSQAARLSAQHELRYRDLFDRIPSAVVLHEHGVVRDANQAALQILGESRRDALMGQDVRMYLPDETARTAFEGRLRHLAAGEAGDVLPVTDMTIRRRDGHLVQVRATATKLHRVEAESPWGAPLSQRRGADSLFLSFMLDDTQRHTALAETARVRALLEAVLAHSPYAFTLSRRRDGLIVECNVAYEHLVGCPRDRLLGRHAAELGLWVQPEEWARYVEALERAGPSLEETLFGLLRSDGQPRLVKGAGALLHFDGEAYVLFIGRDATESVRREAEQQTVLQNAPIGVATTLAGVIVSANPRLHDIFELPQGRMLGMRTSELWADSTRHSTLESQVLRDLSDQGYTRFEESFQRQGHTVVVRMTGQSLPDTGRGPRTVVWIVEDITQDRQAERALQDAARAANAASLAKSAFLANMSHELRTPLNGIMGLLEMALETGRSESVLRQHVELARESSRVLADLLNDVLDLSKIEAGRLEIESAPFELRGLLDSVRTVHEVLAEGRGLQLRFEVDLGSAASVWVHGDVTRVRQILHNYLGNALKFTREGEIVVRVSRLGGEPAQRVRLEVCDTGPGIPPGVQARLFQPFEQGDPSAARRQGGTGLGLAICRELATLMGGRVGVSSQLGQGSRFWADVRLPPTTPPSHSAVEDDAAIHLTGLRILVAEDNPVNTLITTAMLERAGARVHSVTDGQSALHAVLEADSRRDSFALLLMDIQMPGMDGLQATQALRLTHPSSRLPIIALTAGALQTERDAALQAGMDDFVTKPVDRARLLACVRRHAQPAADTGSGPNGVPNSVANRDPRSGTDTDTDTHSGTTTATTPHSAVC